MANEALKESPPLGISHLILWEGSAVSKIYILQLNV